MPDARIATNKPKTFHSLETYKVLQAVERHVRSTFSETDALSQEPAARWYENPSNPGGSRLQLFHPQCPIDTYARTDFTDLLHSWLESEANEDLSIAMSREF